MNDDLEVEGLLARWRAKVEVRGLCVVCFVGLTLVGGGGDGGGVL